MKREQVMDVWRDFAPTRTYYNSPHDVGTQALDQVLFFSAFYLKGELERKRVDIPIYSSYVYAYDLFAQTAYEYHSILSKPGKAYRETSLSLYISSINAFPAVTGVLSVSGDRICPAVLPMMLHYVDSPRLGEYVDRRDPSAGAYAEGVRRQRSRLQEREHWIAQQSQIHRAVSYVADSAHEHVSVYPESFRDVLDIHAVKEMYFKLHERLDKAIRELDDSNRRVNMQVID